MNDDKKHRPIIARSYNWRDGGIRWPWSDMYEQWRREQTCETGGAVNDDNSNDDNTGLFASLFGRDINSKEYLGDLRAAAAYLALEDAAVNDWIN